MVTITPNFRQNFGRQKFFPLAMVTKMVAAWSTAIAGSPVSHLPPSYLRITHAESLFAG